MHLTEPRGMVYSEELVRVERVSGSKTEAVPPLKPTHFVITRNIYLFLKSQTLFLLDHWLINVLTLFRSSYNYVLRLIDFTIKCVLK